MTDLVSCLYHGAVVHRRLAPVRHELRYRVYNFFVDVDELPILSRRLRLFSYNGFNLFSIADRKHGPGDGTSISEHVWRIARAARPAAPVQRIFIFCYPRVLGMVFNPITVYYCYDAASRLVLMIYEVNNTFGERHTYSLPLDGNLQQSCAKEFYVSPFNTVEGRYDFAVEPPGAEFRLGIGLRTGGSPCLKAWFSGTRMPLNDFNLLRSFLSLPVQPATILGGIHWEAAKLWLKGLRIKPRPKPPASPTTILSEPGSPE